MIVWLQKDLNIGEVHDTGRVISINSSCQTSSNIIGMKLELEIKRSQQHCVVTYDSKISPIYLLSAEIQASNLQCNNNYCTNQQTCQISIDLVMLLYTTAPCMRMYDDRKWEKYTSINLWYAREETYSQIF